MYMKIFVKGDYLDFEAPISMTEQQKEHFISFMKTEFGNIKVKNIVEPVRTFNKKEPTKNIKWGVDEHLILFSEKSNEELSIELGISEMAIRMKRGDFIPAFYTWAKKRNYSNKINKKMIAEYFEDK